jgi:chromosome segregation ATPase
MVVIFILVSSGPIWAQNTDILQEIEKVQSEIAGLTDHELPKAEVDLNKLRKTQRDHEAEHTRLNTEYDSIQEDFAQRVAAFKAACSGPMPEGAEYSNCLSRKQNLESYKERTLDPKLMQMEKHADELTRQFLSTNNDIVVGQAKIQKLTNYKSQIESRLSDLRRSLANQCSGVSANASLEELKHKCGNIQFDNPRTDLPPCTTAKCKKADTLFPR